MIERNDSLDMMAIVSDIVAAYVSNNEIAVSELPNFIRQVHQNICHAHSGQPFVFLEPKDPIVPIEESVQPDYIICLEDGRRLKLLKRHLKTAYNMTPDQYRDRWKLPADYPMVAPNYAKRRSNLAKGFGLGVRRAA